MLKYFTSKLSFPVTGTAIAVLVMFLLYLLDSAPGMDNAFIVLSEYCTDSVSAGAPASRPVFDWQTAFLIGITVGAFVASAAGAEFKLELFPDDRQNKGFLHSVIVTPLVCVSGGFLVMSGLQLAGDSFFGLWSSAMQLSTGAWVFMLSAVSTLFFIAAVTVVKLEKGDE